MAAGIRATDLSRWLNGHARLVRAMPNTPALIGLGVTGLAAFPGLGADDRARADEILRAVGQTVWVDNEGLLDAVTAVSGSGPAYVFHFIEAMLAGARALGLDEAQARALTIGTFTGAARLAAESDEPPSVLRERVTSKGGTTAAALAVMSERGIAGHIADAMAAACRRSVELGDEFGRPRIPASERAKESSRAARVRAAQQIRSRVQRMTTLASIVIQPSWSRAHSLTERVPSAFGSVAGSPQTWNGCVSISGRTARKSKRSTCAPGRLRRTRSSSSVAISGPCTTSPP